MIFAFYFQRFIPFEIFVHRILWFSAFAAAIILFVGQVGSRVAVFFEHKTNVAVKVKYVKQIEFPSVTICNQNSYR